MFEKAYFVIKNDLDYWGAGIRNKIIQEAELIGGTMSDDVKIINIKTKECNDFIKKLIKHLPMNNLRYDYKAMDEVTDDSVVYIRYFHSDYYFLKILKRLRNRYNNLLILLEFPTYPYDNELKRLRTKDPIWVVEDMLWRRKLKRYVDYSVTYSRDPSIYGIKCINISNGVDSTKVLIKQSKKQDEVINIIAVATLAFWHGYDRAIEGLNNYYKTNCSRKIILHIVGDGEPFDTYAKLIKQYRLEDKVILYGKLEGKQLEDVYDVCDIGLDSLGRHRSKVYYNSSLKGKEYLMKGLPVISGVETELDELPEFKFYKRVPADDTPINFDDILDYYDSIYQMRSKNELAREIRGFAVNNFDMKVCFDPVIKTIQSVSRRQR